MTDSVVVQARIPADLKRDTENIFSSMGIDFATGIRMFLAQVRMRNGLPFEVQADPFWSEKNQRRLRESIEQYKNGEIVRHDIIEV
ncbi:MAG: type II toxin-antitoxin system RelB/DinJ family antitoxin [Pyramidobacter sp.]|nr:type II toxin-antitoxin system RelB/DinJ family antitoxin [Pyramidobacter sp.]MBQ8129401.1 type II toxin-antitoxin system RelB/DinJ family antitoxin [Clostridia bacterium]